MLPIHLQSQQTNSKLSIADDADSTLKSHTTMDDINGSIEEIDLNADDESLPEPVVTNGVSSPQSPLFGSAIEDIPTRIESPRVLQDTVIPSVVSEQKIDVAPARSVVVAATLPAAKPANESNSDNHFIDIKVDEPKKVGDGMKSYIVYKVTTKTNLPFFRKSEFAVNRRFSDFRGLRDKLAEKHLHVGRIIPPAPDKDAVGTAKVKYGKDESVSGDDFIEKRRASLERYLNRTGKHPTLRADPDFREFLELDTDLPKATNTSALSGAGVRRLFNRVGDTVNKMTFKMDESDQVKLVCCLS